MAEHPDPDLHAPEHPPQSVVNPAVRRTALRGYLGPIVVFFIAVGLGLLYWSNRPADPGADRAAEQAEGTAGVDPDRTDTPGGHDPQRTPGSTREEVRHRGGQIITELGAVIENDGRGEIGRRVEVNDVDVERVDSPTLLWVRDGNVRVAVVVPAGGTVVAGQQVDIVGIVERAGGTARIRASRVTPSEK